jgi:hypothetical protein
MSDFRWNDAEIERAVRQGGARGLNRGARALGAESDARVPVDTTKLRQSRATHDATPDDLEAAVTYNATSEDGFNYALKVHEDTSLDIKTVHNPRAQAKYLESAAADLEEDLMGVVATEIRRAFNS